MIGRDLWFRMKLTVKIFYITSKTLISHHQYLLITNSIEIVCLRKKYFEKLVVFYFKMSNVYFYNRCS